MPDGGDLERADAAAVEVVSGRRTIVTALPLQRTARERLARLLDARVVDVRDPCDAPDVVLTPSCSPQLIGALQRTYPGARIVVVELDDWDLGIELGGPVKRILRAGADSYLLADSVDELAAKLRHAPTPASATTSATARAALPDGVSVDDLITAFLDAGGPERLPRHRSDHGGLGTLGPDGSNPQADGRPLAT